VLADSTGDPYPLAPRKSKDEGDYRVVAVEANPVLVQRATDRLGLTFGIDPCSPALKLPLVGVPRRGALERLRRSSKHHGRRFLDRARPTSFQV